MKKATLNARSFAMTVTIGGLVLLYAFFVFLPTRRAIAEMHEALNEKRQFIIATQRDYTDIGATQQDLERTKDWVADWKQHTPRRNNLGGFFGRVADISRASGARIERISPEDFTELKTLSRHPVRLVVGGQFSELFAFVRGLERIPFAVWIDRLQVRASSKTSEQLTCELNLTVFTDNQDISD